MVQVTWPPCPYRVKTFKILKMLLLQNQKFIIINLACSIDDYEWRLWVDLDLFYGKVKFGSFSIGKSEINDFFQKLLQPVT